jgi:serine phosphatase RsbU (regulator of sigma subunit)
MQARKQQINIVVETLHFRNDQIGFVLFEVGQQDETVHRVLRRQLSSALQGALLVKQVQDDARELAAAYEEINTLNERLKEENLRMSAELDISRRIQQMVLPSSDELKRIEGVDIVGYMQPADEVGGDYYDVLPENGVIQLGIGDVTGHGLESGIVMLMTQTAIRTLIERGETDPVVFLDTLNRAVYKNIQRMNIDKSLTLALVNYEQGTLKIVGQHEEILVVRRGGQVERIDTIDLGFPLGLVEHVADFVVEKSVNLQPGDGVVLYTDGITEAENLQGELYGLERLCTVIAQQWSESAEAIKNAVVDDVLRHIDTQTVYDDITLLVLKQS